MTDATVLIVDDDPQVLELYVRYLEDEYAIRTADDGTSALEEVDEDVDVILLDRRMPGLSGDDFLDEIRDQGLDCAVAMVTAVSPDEDILGMGFQDYLVKPVSRDALVSMVDSLTQRLTYERHIQDWLTLLSKKSALEKTKTEEELRDSPTYASLEAQIEQLNERADEELKEMEEDKVEELFRDLDPEL